MSSLFNIVSGYCLDMSSSSAGPQDRLSLQTAERHPIPECTAALALASACHGARRTLQVHRHTRCKLHAFVLKDFFFAAGFAPGGGSGYRFSEDQAQRIFEELFGSGFGGLGGGLGGGMGGAGGPRVRVFNSGPGGGGLGRQFFPPVSNGANTSQWTSSRLPRA